MNKHETSFKCQTSVNNGSGWTSDGPSASSGGEYRQRANIFVQFGAEQFAGDGLTLDTGRVSDHELHVDLPHTQHHQNESSSINTGAISVIVTWF